MVTLHLILILVYLGDVQYEAVSYGAAFEEVVDRRMVMDKIVDTMEGSNKQKRS